MRSRARSFRRSPTTSPFGAGSPTPCASRASPGAAAEFFRMLGDTDISEVLPTIRVPTLVLHRARWRDAARAGDRIDPRGERGPARRRRQSLLDRRWGPGRGRALPERARGDFPSPTASSRPSSSPTSSARPSARPRSAIGRGAISLRSTTRRCAATSPASAARSSTRPATASSQPSTGRRARSAVRRRSSPTSVSSASTCGRDCTPASASCTTASSPASPSASARAWPPRPVRARCSSRARSRTWLRAPGSSSSTSVRVRSRASPSEWTLYAVRGAAALT